jgi:hypothetical protein
MALGTFGSPADAIYRSRTKEVGGADAGRLRLLGKGRGVADERLCKLPP